MTRVQNTVEIKKLKADYVSYFEDVPVQKYASMFIGRDEDTVIRWRKEDNKFADAVQRAKAKWIRKKVIASKAEFALERLEKEIFSQSTKHIVETSDAQKSSSDQSTSEAFGVFMKEYTKTDEYKKKLELRTAHSTGVVLSQ